MLVELIKNKEELIENIKSFHSLELKKQSGCELSSAEQDEYINYKQMIRGGRNFVVFQINGKYFFTPSKFSGYYRNGFPNTLAAHHKPFLYGEDGRQTSKTISEILKKMPMADEKSEEEYKKFCNQLEIKPSKQQKVFWNLELENSIENFKENVVTIMPTIDKEKKTKETLVSFEEQDTQSGRIVNYVHNHYYSSVQNQGPLIGNNSGNIGQANSSQIDIKTSSQGEDISPWSNIIDKLSLYHWIIFAIIICFIVPIFLYFVDVTSILKVYFQK